VKIGIMREFHSFGSRSRRIVNSMLADCSSRQLSTSV
jgi:hypothetical protein